MGRSKSGQRQGVFARKRDRIAPNSAQRSNRDIGVCTRPKDNLCLARRYRDYIAALVFAEPCRMGRDIVWARFERDALVSGQRHLRNGDQKAAIGDVMHRHYGSVVDECPHQITGTLFGVEINWRRGSF